MSKSPASHHPTHKPNTDEPPKPNIDELFKHLEERLEEMEKKAKAGADPAAEKRANIVVYTCLVLGAICILSGLVAMFLGIAANLVWAALSVGVLLCAISLFKKFKLGPDGLSGDMRTEIMQLTHSTRQFINMFRVH